MNERSIFAEALEKDSLDQRSAYLDQACGCDAALRQRVETLLNSHVQAGSFLGQPVPERLKSQFAIPSGPETEGIPPSGDADQSLGFLSPSDKPGSLGRLGGYEIQEVVGRGGMGIVLGAFDDKLHRVVAIKVMTTLLASNEHARRRFVREGRSAAAIRDDHVIGIHGVDEANGLPFLVMEFIVGRSLAERIEADGPLPLADTLRIGSQIARGLAAAHAQGLVHRDIKPANILLENGVERVKITDFGLAHAVDDVRTTQPGVVVGTPEYMSPEQARGEKVDHRSDLFSLGCVLYAMCAGRPPFRAESTVAIIRRVCEDTPRPLTEINSEIPVWLIDVIDKLIAKDAGERFQTAGEVAELLEQYLAHVQQPAVNPEPAAITKPRPVRPHATTRPHRRWLTAAAAAILLLCAGLSLAETTGVTNLTATVIRIVRGDGTLVVEVDDPNIQVLLDGEEVVITGAGPKEIRLRPGQHELHTLKDGKPFETKLVTITRDGREVVKVAREQPAVVASGPTTRLVWGDNADSEGALSPDGRYMALTDWETGDLHVRELASGATRRVTNLGAPRTANGFAGEPLFSTDGTQLAFTWNYRAEGASSNSFMLNDLRVVPFAGGAPRVVFKDKDRYPGACGWAPDGTWLLTWLNSSLETELARVGLVDGSVHILHTVDDWRKSKMSHVNLSPDGRTIAYGRLVDPSAAHRDIFFIDARSGQETRVTSHAADKQLLGWTPDGRLLYDVERQGSRDAWLLNVVDGKLQGEAKLVKKDLGTISPKGISSAGTLFYDSSSHGPSLYIGALDIEKGAVTVAPLAAEQFNILDHFFFNDWSPDGDYLAYSAQPVGTSRKMEMRILSIKTGQKRVLELTKAQYEWTDRFRWSLDGRSFIGPSRWLEDSGHGTALIDAATGQATTVVEGAYKPVWARDGRGVFYHKVERATGGQNRIVYRDIETQTERDVLPLDFRGTRGLFEPSPDGRQLAVLSKRESFLTLWLVPIDGTAPRELFKGNTPEASTDVYDRVLAWTSDGRHLIFKRGGDDAQSGLWYISTSGGEPRKLTVSGAEAKNISVFAIHSDGKQVALSVSRTGTSEIWALENFLPPLADSIPVAAAEESAGKSK